MRGTDLTEIAGILQSAGVAGAGGAGFPSYKKWEHLKDINHLLVNHQESEPIYYSDKWLARERPEVFVDLIEFLLDATLESVVIGTKEKYRERWMEPLEGAVDSESFVLQNDPIDISSEDGVIFAYTPDNYTFSEEKVLLMVTVGEMIGDDLPTEHGWIVHNTETLYNISRALSERTPVTRKFVHVDGMTPNHMCLDVPVGTPASTLLAEAGMPSGDTPSDSILADGGPGWCHEVRKPAQSYGVKKSTNAILVLEESVAERCTGDDGRIDVRDAYDWSDHSHQTTPRRLQPDSVIISLITNSAYEGLVSRSTPVVEPGDAVNCGDVIAIPDEGISNTQHASIDGVIEDVTDTHIGIEVT